MPDFPKPLPSVPRFDHPPLANLRAVAPRALVRYDSWQGAFFPQTQDQLTEVVCSLLTAGGLNIGGTPNCPHLIVEVTIKALSGERASFGGVLVEVETYLQEKCETARGACKVPAITWSQRLHFWMSFRARPPLDITLRIDGEVRRQVGLFVSDWQRDNPGHVPPLPCSPVPIYPPNPGTPPTPAAAPCDPGGLIGRWGVNLVDLELCSGREKFSNRNRGAVAEASLETFQRLAERGVTLFRLPIRWERLEPSFSRDCTLEPTYLIMLKNMIGYAARVGGHVIIDLHNSYRYCLDEGVGPKSWFVDEPGPAGHAPVPRAYLVRLWERLSTEFADNPTVLAYGIMNQPQPPELHSRDYQWRKVSAEIVHAIRARGDQKIILVDGDHLAFAEKWPELPPPWVEAPRVVYEAHTDRRDTRSTMVRLRPFADWCRRFGVSGFLGSVELDPSLPHHQELADQFRSDAAALGLGWCYWPPFTDLSMNAINGLF